MQSESAKAAVTHSVSYTLVKHTPECLPLYTEFSLPPSPTEY